MLGAPGRSPELRICTRYGVLLKRLPMPSDYQRARPQASWLLAFLNKCGEQQEPMQALKQISNLCVFRLQFLP
eukprot:2779918-Amphidinium_carterae.1